MNFCLRNCYNVHHTTFAVNKPPYCEIIDNWIIMTAYGRSFANNTCIKGWLTSHSLK